MRRQHFPPTSKFHVLKLLQNKQTNKCHNNNNKKTLALAELYELLYWFVIHRHRLGIFEKV